MQAEQRDRLLTDNNLTLVRWVLALSVMVGHCWILTGGYEPFRVGPHSLTYMAVNGFFVLSGMLIAKSLMLGSSRSKFFRSRFLRIWPGLIFLMLAYLVFFGPLYSSAGGQPVPAGDMASYVLRVLLLGDPESEPGVMFAGHYEPIFDGPLWTIRFEVAAYLTAAALVWSGAIKGRWTMLAVALGLNAAYMIVPRFIDQGSVVAGLRLISAFSIGMVLWYWPELRRVGVIGTLACLNIFLFLAPTPLGELAGNIALATGIVWLGLNTPAVEGPLALPDWSYGIYIWHYPILQVLIFHAVGISPAMLFVHALPMVLMMACISWTLVERPALSLKDGVAFRRFFGV